VDDIESQAPRATLGAIHLVDTRLQEDGSIKKMEGKPKRSGHASNGDDEVTESDVERFIKRLSVTDEYDEDEVSFRPFNASMPKIRIHGILLRPLTQYQLSDPHV